MQGNTATFAVKGLLALIVLAAGMLTVIGLAWILTTQLGMEISPSIRNVFAVAFGLFLANRIVGAELARQFEIERKKRNG